MHHADEQPVPTRSRWGARRAVATAVVLVMALVATASGAGAAPPPATDSDNASSGIPYGWFQADHRWTGDLSDPDIVRVGSTYYAYSSPVGGRYLPVATSTDLVNWYAHPKWTSAGPPGAPGYSVENDPVIPVEIRTSWDSAVDKYNNNDGLVQPASWGVYHQQGLWLNRDLWAPGVLQIGSTWFAYSAVRVSNQMPGGEPDPHGYGRFCLTVASAPGPLGPFRDISGSGPIQCQSPATDPGGSIDPNPYHDPSTGKDYLLWKAAGKVSSPGLQGHESALLSVELGADGKPLPGAAPVQLFETNRQAPWQGGTIENPSMVQYEGITYLFFAANDSVYLNDNGDSFYAEGYAICPNGPRGGCYQPPAAVSAPLLSSTADQKGQAGGDAFIDGAGNLQLSYAYYWAGEVRPQFPYGSPARHPRRLATTRLVRNADNTLTRQAVAAPGPPTVQGVQAGNGQVTVSWAPPSSAGGSPVAGYTVIPVVDGNDLPGRRFASAATTQTVTGLLNGATYTFRVAATNAQGTGLPSGPSSAATPSGPTSHTSTQKFVAAAWADFLGHPPSNQQLAIAGAQIDGGALTRAQLVLALAGSPEWVTGLVDQLYTKTLGRPGDPGGTAYWTQQIRSGARSVADVSANFYASAEYFGGIGGGMNRSWVADLYRKLLLRAADPAGLDYWTAQAGATGQVSVALRFFQSSESAHTRVNNLYLDLLHRPSDPAGADYWAGRVITDGDIVLAANLASSLEYFTLATR